MLGEICQHTPAVLSLHGRELAIRRTRGMKEGCPLSPTLFLLCCDTLLRETMEICLAACLYVFVDDTVVWAPTTEALLQTLDTLHEVAHTMGLRVNKHSTDLQFATYHWATPTPAPVPTHSHIFEPRFGPPHTRRDNLGHGDYTTIPRHSGLQNCAVRWLQKGSHYQSRPHPPMDLQRPLPG